MMKKLINSLLLLPAILLFMSCQDTVQEHVHLRPLADTIGFAHLDWQMDSVMARINKFGEYHPQASFKTYEGIPRVIIAPHDDYTYVGDLYKAALQSVRANTVILFGVAHKAAALNLEDRIVFDSYDYWSGPYGRVKVSPMREEIILGLPNELFEVNDSMHRMEHSLEALIPFLQYFNRDVEIVPILVPYMSFEHMQEIAAPLAAAIDKATIGEGLGWGLDFAMVITTDAVHYGDEDWGGKDFARYGTDSAGYAQALALEHAIMDTLSGALNPGKLEAFCDITVEEEDYHKYKWTWCGRYSVPMGLLTAFELNERLSDEPLYGSIIGYANSIDHPRLRVDDLRMGVTAPANMHHWVGYAALGYE